LGTYEDGLAFIEQHLHRAEQTGNDFVKYSILAKKAETLTAIGQYHRALEIYQPVIGYVESNYGSVMKAKVMLEMAYAHTCLGEFAHSRQLLDESMAIASQAGQKNMLAAIYAEFGILAYYEGGETNWQAALETCQQGIAMLRNTEWIAEIARPLIVTAALLEKLGSAADALQASQEAMQFSNTWPVAPVVFNLVHSRALRGVGNIADADQYLNMAYERIRSVAEIFENELYQQSWLDAIPIHRQVLADVAEYLPQVQLTSEVE
jgi:tetratricopeptide (TPR) repeat protein